MELVVFDLDGTLLDGKSRVSEHTTETLGLLRERNIAYTVATGRTLHASRDLLEGHGFHLPHIYKNGVVIWRPEDDDYSHSNLLTKDEIRVVVEAFLSVDVTPFIFTIEPCKRHAVYHPPLRNDVERQLVKVFGHDRGLAVCPVGEMPGDADITNISALGAPQAIQSVARIVESEEHLVAYAGTAMEGNEWHWIDVHHSAASKGGAIETLKADLGVSRVICFGDSENDLSMFAMADESYAPSNAREAVKQAATAVIGHHDQDGISLFLRERFGL